MVLGWLTSGQAIYSGLSCFRFLNSVVIILLLTLCQTI
jgi:hypothetical protein